jgi:hypothetical protein
LLERKGLSGATGSAGAQGIQATGLSGATGSAEHKEYKVLLEQLELLEQLGLSGQLVHKLSVQLVLLVHKEPTGVAGLGAAGSAGCTKEHKVLLD